MTHPLVGRPAPALRLPDTHGTPVSLEDLRGTPALVVFLPFAFSGTCTAEVRGLAAVHDALAAASVRVLGVTCDAMWTLRAWAQAEALPFDLLSDFWPHGAASAAYGALDRTSGAATRLTVLLDHTGVVSWVQRAPAGTARDLGEVRRAVAALADRVDGGTLG